MKIKILDDAFDYDGSQLKSLFAYMNHGILGDSIVAGVGSCDVTFDHMIDGEDLREQAAIRSASMLHFIIEKFNIELFSAVSLQRLFASMAIDVLRDMSSLKDLTARLRRDGDDIFCDDLKFSISIASRSATSNMVHFAVNVSNENTPVPTVSLADFQVEPFAYARRLADAFAHEVESIQQATMKVRPLSSF